MYFAIIYINKSKLLRPLLFSDKIHKVLNEVFLPGAGGPAVVVFSPDEVDDWGEAGAA